MLEKIVTQAKIIAGIDAEDEKLSLCCEDALNYVLAFCHLSELPEKLCGITAQLAVSGYNSSGDIASIKEGDREITYAFGAFDNKLRPFVNCSGRVPSEVVRDV